MRIIIDARLIHETGVGRYIRNLVSSLAVQDTKNSYILLTNKSSEQIQRPGKNWEVHEINIPWHSVREQIQLPIILIKLHADVVHIPYFTIPILYPGRMVVTIHDLIVSHFKTGRASTHSSLFYALKHWMYLCVVYVGLIRANHVIAVSQATKNELVSHYPFVEKKVSVTYEGVDPLLATPALPKIAKPYFLYVGNFYPHKNVDTLIHALKDSGNSSELVLVGKKDIFAQKVKQLVSELGLLARVHFIHDCSDAELSGLYSNALSLVVPSLMEGFSLPPIEALSLGCPVICSDIPVHKEILGDVPEYFAPKDTQVLAQLLSSAAKNKIHLKKESVKELLSKYSWETMANHTRTIYAQIGGSSGS